ncbi:MAG: 4Fe-4S cluster-binding domain-containing protein [Clostridia bacterium]|nr:4Fe-4S cluster-binding domain-containing protein [Clostridia bacterium]
MEEQCLLCPRECRVDRNNRRGFCGLGTEATVAKVMLHPWEEPCICYGKGSGAVFFSGCQLKCVFCQNYEISCKPKGKAFTSEELAALFLNLEEQGACNVNLITATPHLEAVIPALEKAKTLGLKIPVVFNCGGYEKAETIRRLSGLVDVYLPDFKFFDPSLSSKYASCSDYADKATTAIREMILQKSQLTFEGDRLTSGVIIRHLVLPGCSKDSLEIINILTDLKKIGEFALSLLWQYTPTHKTDCYPEINRRVTRLEYERVYRFVEKSDFPLVYTQEKESASTAFIPDFSVKFLDK